MPGYRIGRKSRRMTCVTTAASNGDSLLRPSSATGTMSTPFAYLYRSRKMTLRLRRCPVEGAWAIWENGESAASSESMPSTCRSVGLSVFL